MLDVYSSTMKALGVEDGYLLDWRAFHGCQLVSQSYKNALSCPEREAVWQCEVIGPHTKHRWSQHLMAHERFGNGHSCASVGDDFKAAMTRLYPWSRASGAAIGKPVVLGHAFEGDGPHCTGWIESRMGGGVAGTLIMRQGCGYPRSSHEH
jgi:hypothetical protein